MSNPRTVILGGGCFWCTEAIFRSVDGVLEVTSGYAGGDSLQPTYEDVVSDRPASDGRGHAEVVQVTYDADRLPLAELLRVHLTSHDPTHPMKNASHARSVIFTEDEADEAVARALVASTPQAATEVRARVPFHRAEERHQRYAEKNPNGGYTLGIIAPKLRRLRAALQPSLEGRRTARIAADR